MKRGFVYFRPLQVGYVRAFGPYKISVHEAWHRLDDWCMARRIDIGHATRYGLAHDNPRSIDAAQLRYDACVEIPADLVAETGDEIRLGKLPSGAYARKRYVGPYDGISEAFTTLRTQWETAADVVLDSRRPLLTVYLNNPRVQAAKDLKVDICVPVVSVAKGRHGHEKE